MSFWRKVCTRSCDFETKLSVSVSQSSVFPIWYRHPGFCTSSTAHGENDRFVGLDVLIHKPDFLGKGTGLWGVLNTIFEELAKLGVGRLANRGLTSLSVKEARSTLQWRHNEHDGVLNHQHYDCLLNPLFRRRSKRISKLRVTGLCAGNSPGPVCSRTKGQ